MSLRLYRIHPYWTVSRALADTHVWPPTCRTDSAALQGWDEWAAHTELTSPWKWFNRWCLITRMMEKPPVKLACSPRGCLTPLVFCRQQGIRLGRPRPYLTSLCWSHGASAFRFSSRVTPIKIKTLPWPPCFCTRPIYKLQRSGDDIL